MDHFGTEGTLRQHPWPLVLTGIGGQEILGVELTLAEWTVPENWQQSIVAHAGTLGQLPVSNGQDTGQCSTR